MTPVNNIHNNAVIQRYNSEPINIRDYIRYDNIKDRVSLSISSMNNLRALPESLGNEQDIEVIHITDTPIESLPESIANLQNLRKIILINTAIRALPESIGNIPNLESLTISNAPISSLPNSMGNLPDLFLCFTGTQITMLPNTITNLFDILSDPEMALSSELRQNLYLRREVRLTRFIENFTSAEEIESLTLTRLLDGLLNELYRPSSSIFGHSSSDRASISSRLLQLYNYMNRPMPTFTHIKNIPSINQWITRLVNISCTPLLLEILEYAEENSNFRERLALNIEESLSACNDRLIFYLNLIYMEKRLYSIDRTNSSELANFLLYIAFPTDLISKISKQKSIAIGITGRYHEEIEIYLAYLIGLNETLNLGLSITNMQFRQMSRITEKDIKSAKKLIRDEMSNPNKYVPFLIEHHAWIEFLQTIYPQEMEEIREKGINLINTENANSSERINNAKNAQAFRNRYLALLTLNHLNSVNDRN